VLDNSLIIKYLHLIIDDQGVLRKVVCNEGMNNFKNVKCVQDAGDDPIVIGLHNIMFGYLNMSTNCSETQGMLTMVFITKSSYIATALASDIKLSILVAF
jgi:hypothetical protein